MVIIAGGIAWTLGSLYSKNHAMGDSLLTNAALQFLAAGAFSGMAALVAGEWRKFHFSAIGPAAWSALGYLTIMGSLVTYLAYIWLLGKRPAAQVSTYVYVNPVIAVLLGALAAHEHITALQLLALTIILGGVIMVNANKYFRRPVEDLDPGNNLSR